MNMNTLVEQVRSFQFPGKLDEILEGFFSSYAQAVKGGPSFELLQTYLRLIKESIDTPPSFDHFHPAERAPFDYYMFGLNMVRPLIDRETSYVEGKQHVHAIAEAVRRGENVILFANHQTEIDPQVISLLLEPIEQDLASSMIFVAGHRVTSDPMAIPFSRGRNLLCIHSKKYIDSPPEGRSEKLLHNAKTMAKLEQLLGEGGVCIYVAPSGGRDRYDETGSVKVSAFDPQSIELFRLLSQKTGKKTHLHLLALDTFHLLPPPATVNVELGELRDVTFGPARLNFGPALLLEDVGDPSGRIQRRIERCEQLTSSVEEMYNRLLTRNLPLG
jgi:glycerol-3-phosphate O-acyltransferase